MKNLEDYYVNIKWLTFVIPVLGVSIYEVFRYQIFQKLFGPIVNSLILMVVVGVFGFFFSNWLFERITSIHNSLFWEQQRLKTIFNHTSDGIIVLDEECKILDINPAAEKLTGWRAREVVNSKTCDEMNGCSTSKEECWNSEDPEGCMNVDCGHRECWGKTCLEKKISLPYIEMCLLRKNGQKIKIAASYSYIPGVGDERPQVKLVLRDISERKEFEKAIQNYATLEERYRLAREMHDGLAQALVYINIKAHSMQKSVANNPQSSSLLRDLSELRQVTQETVNEVRQNIFDLKTYPKEETSCFRVWIEDYLKYMGTINHIETEFNCDSSEALILPTEIKVQLIRIIQEGLTNIRKHAGATKASIYLWKGSKDLLIRIMDNGRGINPADLLNRKNHFGLNIMQERAQIIGGSFKILANEPRGTLLEIKVPLYHLYENKTKII
ncbi:MAG: PAS domain S-box protein [Peptococcaceae bacterium]